MCAANNKSVQRVFCVHHASIEEQRFLGADKARHGVLGAVGRRLGIVSRVSSPGQSVIQLGQMCPPKANSHSQCLYNPSPPSLSAHACLCLCVCVCVELGSDYCQ